MSSERPAEFKERLEALFDQAADLPLAERAAFVERECGEGGALRDDLVRLLKGLAGEDVLGKLQPGAPTRAGSRIGPYELLERVGEGGMGEVYSAQQHSPVVRRVALKIIKPGMDSALVVARFGAERQALARMTHPSIAQVYDAGKTESGSPYFVMEYVDGEPITDWCDRHKLSTQERIRLFVRVCEAVQHAHQKGVIHRDLKPSNLLVTTEGGRAVPKIIDFGVARATSGKLAHDTLLTIVGQVLGTLDYMSPEQADPTSVDIDTRSDIYSLGVVLYQLLSGLLPLEHDRTADTPFSEIQRAIREEDPPTPSTRLRRKTGTASTVAPLHGTDERSLLRQLTGDLDWICMKALEKDPARRYQSASELAQDLGRHLAHEPVLAGRPGTLYRARKFVRRHRVGVTAGVLIVAALVAGTFGIVSGRIDAMASEKLARALQPQADIYHVKQLVAQADLLWPPHPDRIEALEAWLARAKRLASTLPDRRRDLEAMRARALPWSSAEREADRASSPEAGELARLQAVLALQVKRVEAGVAGKELDTAKQRIPKLEPRVAALEEKVIARRTWAFASDVDRSLHEAMVSLIDALEGLIDEKTGSLGADAVSMDHGWSVPKRLAFARELASGFAPGGRFDAAWAAALPQILAAYPELPELRPQMGLVPIGPDPATGLWEFSHLATSAKLEPARRGADGKIVMEDGMGLVLVLLHGGKYRMGADVGAEPGPNIDPHSVWDEHPAHDVEVAPFFVSKLEMTQEQWRRCTGVNPSVLEGEPGPQKPVNNVSASECDRVCREIGLILPDEAQWEFAARAGTTSVWSTGDEAQSLIGYANLFDQSSDSKFPEWKLQQRVNPVDWDDGSPVLTPVGAYGANPFGLFDVHGNAREWTSNEAYLYGQEPGSKSSGRRVARGGDSRSDALEARSSKRTVGTAAFRNPALGLRPARAVDP